LSANSDFTNTLNRLRPTHRHSRKFFLRKPESVSYTRPSRPTRRGVRVVTCAGRDAMDASGAGRRHAACGRRRRVVLSPRRWGQVPGQKPGATEANKPGTPGRARDKP
jgi:hypothetical protein